MNIEQAIAYLEECIQRQNAWCDYTGVKEMRLAIAALREKAEREKGCAFCNTGAHRILQNALYCPRCGKRLEVNNG